MRSATLIQKTLTAAAMAFLLSCGPRDTLYNPTDNTQVHCAAFIASCPLADSTATMDTARFVSRDTVHTNVSIGLVGRITPPTARLKAVEWDFGDGSVYSTEERVCHAYDSAGVYSAVFTITDSADLSISDSVTVTVNTPPATPVLVLPDSALNNVNPQDDRLFKWRCVDPDGETPWYTLCIDTTPVPVREAARLQDTSFLVTAGTFTKLTTYYWRVVAVDRFGDSAKSSVFVFSTRDPNPSTTGTVSGTAVRQGLTRNGGITVTIMRNSSILGITTTDTSGRYTLADIAGGDAQIILDDSVFFKPETLTVTVVNGVTTVVPTAALRDTYPPRVSVVTNSASDTVRMGTSILIHIAAVDTLYGTPDSIRANYGFGMHRITMDTLMTFTVPGNYVIGAEAYDVHGNVGSAQRTIHVNAPPPSPTLTSPIHWAELSAGQVTFSWTCTDPDAAAGALRYTLLLDTHADLSAATVFEGLTQPTHIWTASAQDEGTHYWRVKVSDGMDSAVSTVDSFRVSVGTGRITGRAVRQDLASTPRNAGISVVAVKGGVVQRSTSTDSTGAFAFADLSGSVTVRVIDVGFSAESTTVDVVNGVSVAATTLTIRDTLAPIIARSADVTVRASTQVQVTATASDTFYSVDSFFVDYGSGARRVVAVDTGIVFAAPGDHFVGLRAVDVHRNTRRDSVRIHVNYPPDKPVHASPASNARVEPNSSPVFTWGCADTDNPADLRYDVYIGTSHVLGAADRQASALSSSQYTWPSSGSDARTCYWRVAAFDGYDTTWSDIDSFRVAPALIKVYGWAMLEGVQRHNGIRLRLTSAATGDVYPVYVNDMGYGYTTVPPAAYTAAATDTLRGVFAPAGRSFDVAYADSVSWDTLVLQDERSPSIACTYPAAGATLRSIASRSLTITGTLVDTGSGIRPDSVRISIKGAPVSGVVATPTTWQYTYASIPDGRYDIVVNARDSAGNAATPLARTFYVNCKTIAATVSFEHDTMICSASVANVSPSIRAYYWNFEKHRSAAVDDSSISASTSIVKRWPLPHPPVTGPDTLVVMAVDQNGMQVFDTVAYTIVQDRPIVRAGSDTGVTMGSSISVNATYTQRFGRIVKWEWAMNVSGSGPSWTVTPGSSNTVTAPSVYVPEYLCYVRATDDLGVMDTDTVVVTVGINWEPVGVRGMSPGAVGSYALAGTEVSGNILVAFADSSNGAKIRVMSYDGSSWSDFGNVGFSNGPASYVQLRTGQDWGGSSGTGYYQYDVYYVAYYDRVAGTNDSVRVRKYTGSTWDPAGSQNLVNGNIDYRLSVSGSIPTICMSDRSANGKIAVKKRDPDWAMVGTYLSTKTYAGVDGFANGSIVLYDAGTDDTIKTLNQTSWNYTAAWSAGPSSNVLMATYYSNIYLLDNYNIASKSRLAVQKFDGSSWSFVDSLGLDTAISYGNGLYNASGALLVAFHQGRQWEYVTVKTLVNNRWKLAGRECFMTGPGQTSPLDIIVCKGVPYIAFKDIGNSGRLTVMRLR